MDTLPCNGYTHPDSMQTFNSKERQLDTMCVFFFFFLSLPRKSHLYPCQTLPYSLSRSVHVRNSVTLLSAWAEHRWKEKLLPLNQKHFHCSVNSPFLFLSPIGLQAFFPAELSLTGSLVLLPSQLNRLCFLTSSSISVISTPKQFTSQKSPFDSYLLLWHSNLSLQEQMKSH